MKKYTINYGFGIALLYTPSEDWESRLYCLANQCFGIRKSIYNPHLIKRENAWPEDMIDGEYERIEHDGDVIVWNDAGEKIKSEWD